GHGVHVVREIFPGAADAGHFRLAAEDAFGADFACDARHFGRKAVELVDHRIDGVLEFEDFAFDVDGDLAGQVAFGHGGGHLGDVTDLGRKVRGHGVDGVGQIFPRAADAGHYGLAAELAFGTDFARDARDRRSVAVGLVDDGVEGVF